MMGWGVSVVYWIVFTDTLSMSLGIALSTLYSKLCISLVDEWICIGICIIRIWFKNIIKFKYFRASCVIRSSSLILYESLFLFFTALFGASMAFFSWFLTSPLAICDSAILLMVITIVIRKISPIRPQLGKKVLLLLLGCSPLQIMFTFLSSVRPINVDSVPPSCQKV